MIDLTAELPREEARRALARRFTAAGLDSPGLDARLLLCAALAIDHAALIRDPDVPLGTAAAARLEAMAARRLSGEPVSRLLGRREFFGLEVALTSDVLDPRPATETLVEAMLAALAGRHDAPLRILDLGVGSGAILAALLNRLPQAFGIGTDLSAAACAVAQANLGRLDLAGRSRIVCGRWSAALNGCFDVIVSNPPYIDAAEMPALPPAVTFDPRLALYGGPDGLAAYREIVPALPALLAADGCVGLEIGHRQFDAVAALAAAAGLRVWGGALDLAGHPRMVAAGRGKSPVAWQIRHKAAQKKDISRKDLAQAPKATSLQA